MCFSGQAERFDQGKRGMHAQPHSIIVVNGIAYPQPYKACNWPDRNGKPGLISRKLFSVCQHQIGAFMQFWRGLYVFLSLTIVQQPCVGKLEELQLRKKMKQANRAVANPEKVTNRL